MNLDSIAKALGRIRGLNLVCQVVRTLVSIGKLAEDDRMIGVVGISDPKVAINHLSFENSYAVISLITLIALVTLRTLGSGVTIFTLRALITLDTLLTLETQLALHITRCKSHATTHHTRNSSVCLNRSIQNLTCPSVNPSKLSESAGARQRRNVPAITS